MNYVKCEASKLDCYQSVKSSRVGRTEFKVASFQKLTVLQVRTAAFATLLFISGRKKAILPSSAVGKGRLIYSMNLMAGGESLFKGYCSRISASRVEIILEIAQLLCKVLAQPLCHPPPTTCTAPSHQPWQWCEESEPVFQEAKKRLLSFRTMTQACPC